MLTHTNESHSIVRNKPANSSTLIDGDGAAGDPASMLRVDIPI